MFSQRAIFEGATIMSVDFLGRALLTAAFTIYASLFAAGVWQLFNATPVPPTFAVDVASRIASLCFAMLIIVFTVIRLPPKSQSAGWTPRIVAIAGTFMTLAVAAWPQADTPPAVRLVATIIIIAGTILSTACLVWLGRSFSIDAQARRLVTAGPYSIVRHPLYVAEAVTFVGLALKNMSVWSFSIIAINLAFQYWRILNEERVLQQAFPEYEAYARSVPRLVPFFASGVTTPRTKPYSPQARR